MYLTKNKFNLHIRFIPVFFLFVVIFFSGCSKDDNPAGPVSNPGANEVIMQNIAFSPSSKTVAVGTTIKWINKDNTTHDVISGTPGNSTGLFNSGDLGVNGEFTFTFDQAGTFSYFCSHHAGMTGTIIVQ
jgi:plastocyanin